MSSVWASNEKTRAMLSLPQAVRQVVRFVEPQKKRLYSFRYQKQTGSPQHTGIASSKANFPMENSRKAIMFSNYAP